MELDQRGKELLEAALQAREVLNFDPKELLAIASKLTSEPNAFVLSILNGAKSKWYQAAVEFTEYCISANLHK